MQRGISFMSLEPTDMLTSIEVAAAAGYDVLESDMRTVVCPFLDQGHTVEELAARLESVSLRPNVITAGKGIDMPPSPERDQWVGFCRRTCEAAQAIACPNIGVASGVALAHCDWPTIRTQTARGLRQVAEIVAEYGLHIAYEPLAWVSVRSLEQALEVIDEAGCSNVGLTVDTFHLFAGESDLGAVSKLDIEQIRTVHLGDAAAPQLDGWSDEDRTALPGEGVVPLRKIMRKIRDIGFDGVVTDEMSSQRYSSWSRLRIAETLKAKADAVIASL